MNRFDKEILKSLSQEEVRVPKHIHDQIEETLENLPQRVENPKIHVFRNIVGPIAACLAFVFLGLIPNISVAYAKAVDDIPVLGDLVRVFTIRNYEYSDANENYELKVNIARIDDMQNAEAGELINKNIDELTSAVMEQFYHDMELSNGNGHGSIHIDYETVSNTEQWFTLKLIVSEVAASSDTYFKFYHIDRTTGKYVTFRSLFKEEDFPVIEQWIVDDMKAQMAEDENKVYWVEETELGQSLTALEEDQNFYFNEKGNLVIVYDKYEVGPGSMGCPEFEIPKEVYQSYLRYQPGK